MSTGVENLISSVQSAAISVVHYVVLLLEAYSALLCQGVLIRTPVLDPPLNLMLDILVLEAPDMGT